MKTVFLKREPANTRLILVFTGWSTDWRAVGPIDIEGWDVAVAHSYSDLRTDPELLAPYFTVYVFAWSLGVYAASRVLDPKRVTAAFAVNGTLRPVDDNLGIPEVVFNATSAGLSASSLQKFRLRMAGGREAFKTLAAALPPGVEDDIEALRNQLETIRDCKLAEQALPWARAYISDSDRIFPPGNMEAAWALEPEVEVVRLPGSPHWVDLAAIVRGVVADPAKVSARFAKASGSYDTHAIAQNAAAIRLTDLLMSVRPAQGGRILEIGCGTGLFTRQYAPRLRPAEADFVDIAPVGPFGVAPRESYAEADAERWIAASDKCWDVILSASAIQWFADIPRFLADCHARLAPRGVLALSTFLPGNLAELDEFRPAPLVYPKAALLRRVMESLFDDVQIVEDEIKVGFRTLRDVLMHLKHTGVAGSAPGKATLPLSAMSRLRSLTYRPVYIVGRRR